MYDSYKTLFADITSNRPRKETIAVVAVPVYRRRIAPVLDFSSRIVLLNLNHEQKDSNTEILWKGLSQSERLKTLTRAGVTTLICAGISETLHALLINAGIRVIWGIAGPVDEVASAYISNKLEDTKFNMPGHNAGLLSQRSLTIELWEAAEKRKAKQSHIVRESKK
jgi:predicted Fe-Mo cluster-binding NifX family protein